MLHLIPLVAQDKCQFYAEGRRQHWSKGWDGIIFSEDFSDNIIFWIQSRTGKAVTSIMLFHSFLSLFLQHLKLFMSHVFKIVFIIFPHNIFPNNKTGRSQICIFSIIPQFPAFCMTSPKAPLNIYLQNSANSYSTHLCEQYYGNWVKWKEIFPHILNHSFISSSCKKNYLFYGERKICFFSKTDEIFMFIRRMQQ